MRGLAQSLRGLDIPRFKQGDLLLAQDIFAHEVPAKAKYAILHGVQVQAEQ